MNFVILCVTLLTLIAAGKNLYLLMLSNHKLGLNCYNITGCDYYGTFLGGSYCI